MRVNFVRNFLWAPQRYQSRATPLSREARRLDPVFDSLGSEAQSTKDRDRRKLCIEFLRAFSGSNFSRLLVGGMLADLSVEHCI